MVFDKPSPGARPSEARPARRWAHPDIGQEDRISTTTNPKAAMRNLYLETASPGPEIAPLAGDASADARSAAAAVPAALHPAEAGLSAVLIESGEIGHGRSGRNGGQVDSGLKLGPDEVELSFWTEPRRRR